MRRAIFLPSVRDDLLDILTYIAEASGSVTVAETFVRKLRQRCHELASFDGTLGRARPELRADIRSVSHKNDVIFFRYVAGRFEVANIVERHRDIDTHFHDDDGH